MVDFSIVADFAGISVRYSARHISGSGGDFMTSKIRDQWKTIAALFLMSAVSARTAYTAPAAGANAQGDLWEVTSQMSMEGMEMAMPAQTLKVCAAKTWNAPPTAANEQQKCRNSDFKVEGPKATWKTTCENPPMTGVGEITKEGASAFAGSIKFASDAGNMKITLNGRRLGDCDNPQN
jgi:hypothetical protein